MASDGDYYYDGWKGRRALKNSIGLDHDKEADSVLGHSRSHWQIATYFKQFKVSFWRALIHLQQLAVSWAAI